MPVTTEQFIKDHLEDLKRQLRDQNIPCVQVWKPATKKRLLIGKVSVTPTEHLGEPGATTERKVFIDLDGAEWQVRQSIRDGIKSMLMVPMIIEEV